MNLLAWSLALGLLVSLMVQAVDFQRATVCRQEAWRMGLELKTRATLSNPKVLEREWHLGCRLHLLRDHESITWQRLPNIKSHQMEMPLKGKL